MTRVLSITMLALLLCNPAIAGSLAKLKRAAQFDTVSKYNLAVSYETGDGTPKDIEAAARLYAEAANDGLPDAQSGLVRSRPVRQWRFVVWMRDGVPVERTKRRTTLSMNLE